ncbi:GWxTD domain-containing protein [Terracidiphilus gabretensis]|uniref:GWxTD domain-containing protein n=1 Tax=Terracidiphilus gabretensis TaxID=1577687 RepID=UPI00071B68FB|nr:GWxTD domain-containing protein [Terracidiphilus gabretensis]
MTHSRSSLFATAVLCGLFAVPAARMAAQQSTPPPSAGAATQDDQDPLKRKRSDKETLDARKNLRTELKGAYKTWLEQDVAYIITDEERKAFRSLSNDEERESFIENFWLRRNPNPDSPENEFRDEHYRRIQYANDHYAAGKPGWKTDRGHIYIAFGKPDSTDSHPSGGAYQRPIEEGGGQTSTFPFETWHYRYLEGIGDNIDIEFVDTCQCGDYHFTIDRSEKDALLRVPGAGLTQWEEMGMAKKADRFKGSGEALGLGPQSSGQNTKEFDRIELAAKLFAPPPIKFKDLEGFISEHTILTGPPLPFDVRTDFVRVTESTVLVPITVQLKNRDLTFVTKDGVSTASVNILGKVTTLTHKTVQTFEDTVSVQEPAELLEKALDSKKIYWQALPLLPGLYRIDIAIKDVNNPDHVGLYGRGINVPTFDDEKLSTSSLILSDNLAPVDSHSVGTGTCVIGGTKICPRVQAGPATPVSYKRNQNLAFWMQVYNLSIDEQSKSNLAKVTYQIIDSTTNNVIFEKEIESKDLGAHSNQLTVEKLLPIAGLQPGKYKVTIKVNDTISKQEIAQSAPFVVE